MDELYIPFSLIYGCLLLVFRPALFVQLMGGPFVEPPQHWERDRWSLPIVQRTSERLLELYAEGGRAVENFMRINANPSDELSILVAAQLEASPTSDWQALLRNALNELYQPQNADALESLARLFLDAEDAYFTNTMASQLQIMSS